MSTLAELEQTLDILRKERDKINEDIADIHKDMKQLIPSPRNMKNVLFPIVRDFNAIIGDNVTLDDLAALFRDNEKIKWFPKADVFDLLVAAGCFESKGQARKNWTGIKELNTGWTEIGPIGKGKVFIFPSIQRSSYATTVVYVS